MTPVPPPGPKPLRLWAYRVGAIVLVPSLFFGALEGGLRLAGFGHSGAFLIADDRPGYLRTNPDFVSLFLPGNFDLRAINFRVAKEKPANTLRVVVLGESAAQGIPVPTFGFATLLRAQLRACYPDRQIEVLNTGIVAINSHVVDRIARDMAVVHPDLYVVYTGNNEVVGPYGPGCAYLPQTPPRAVIRASVFVRSTRVGQAAAWLIGKLAGHRKPTAEWGGMSMFVDNAVRGDDPRLEGVYANYEANLRDIVRVAQSAGAKTLLCTMVSNLRDCPPLLSVHRPGLSAEELGKWTEAFTAGRLQWKLGRGDLALEAMTRAQRIDGTYADVPYILGSLALGRHATAEARQWFVQAEHWDALRFRPDPRINEIIRKVASGAASDLRLLDAAVEMGSDPASTGPIAGRDLLFEHVHFDWPGNQVISRAMARETIELFPEPGASGRLLDADAVAAAVAYTEHERLPMLLRIEILVRKPPFSNQLTYPEDELRLTAMLRAAASSAQHPLVLSKALRVAKAAEEKDPNNPLLAGIVEGIELDSGHLPQALAEARRAGALLPSDPAADADIATLLAKLGKTAEAEAILLAANRSGADMDLLAPAYAAFFSGQKRYRDALQFLDTALTRHPADRRLALVRAGVLNESGDGSGAEAAYRAILVTDPSNEEALEQLVGLLSVRGQGGDVATLSVSYAPFQERNQLNDLRAAKVAEAGGDEATDIRFLLAAERSGPVNATFELTVALKLYKAGRMPEVLDHLADAQLLAIPEGKSSLTASIGALIERMQREASLSAPLG